MNIQGITPEISAPVNAKTATATTSAGSSSTTANNSLGTSASSLQDTFLNLLVTELQNQDPTAPVDPTEMVGQMVSLNQLDQLISINQTLDSMAGSSSGTSTSAQTSSAANAMLASGAAGSTAGSTTGATSSPRVAGASTSSQQVPAYTPTVDPNALMNLYGSFATPAAN